MERRELLILLLAGLCGPASNQIRKHVFVPITLSWSLAQTYCREQHTDLATVCSQEEAEQLLTLSELSLIDSAWIGLYRDDTKNWQWSNSDDVIYSNWNTGEPNNVFGVENCAIMSLRNSLFLSRGKWVDVVCGGILPFFCYEDGLCSFEEAEETWHDAQSYCRNQSKELVTIQYQARVNETLDLLNSTGSSDAWIGLYHDKENWQWSKGDAFIYYNWSTVQFCASVNSEGEWEDRACSETTRFMCDSDNMAIGRVKFTAPKGVNLEDPKVSEAILEQIQEHFSKKFPMERVNMRWRKQDGEIFHKDVEEEDEEKEEEEKCSEP
ncbi:UNVERIFIED_CONTAM: hypothetical protein FKN15_036099 [Acipenser sinensis]